MWWCCGKANINSEGCRKQKHEEKLDDDDDDDDD